jgi:hypothetical protein
VHNPLPIECLRQWAGAWAGDRGVVAKRLTASSPRDVRATRWPEQCFIALNAQGCDRNPTTDRATQSPVNSVHILGSCGELGYGVGPLSSDLLSTHRGLR